MDSFAPSANDNNRQPNLEHIDGILSGWKSTIGEEYQGYRNHVARVVNFCLYLHPCSAEELRKIEVAACFHDIGIWTANTFDYLPPSILSAKDYLVTHGLEDWTREIEQMILLHHKIRPVGDSDSQLVELFRQADLVDFSLGMIRHGVPADAVSSAKAKYPNAGFHKCLLRRAFPRLLRHPLNPLPMVKW